MELSTNYFDLWLYSRTENDCCYLLLRTSQEKANKWFGGARFWQIPTDKVDEGEVIEEAAERVTTSLGLDLRGLWASEYVYTIYNHRRRDISIIPVFAGEVEVSKEVNLDWEHSEYEWCTKEEASSRLTFRGLRAGIIIVEETITSLEEPPGELRLL